MKQNPWLWTDLSGQRFGHLTAISRSGSDGKKSSWLVKCDCGKETVKVGSELKRGKVLTCGRGCPFFKKLQARRWLTHGMSRHPVFAVWRSMLDRCRLPTHRAWKNYGGRGIAVCDRWKEGFLNFWEDVRAGYCPGLELDRIDNDRGYCPENVRWVPRLVNSRNRRNSVARRLGAPENFLDLARARGVKRSTLYYRANTMGWSWERILSTPVTPANAALTKKERARSLTSSIAVPTTDSPSERGRDSLS